MDTQSSQYDVGVSVQDSGQNEEFMVYSCVANNWYMARVDQLNGEFVVVTDYGSIEAVARDNIVKCRTEVRDEENIDKVVDEKVQNKSDWFLTPAMKRSLLLSGDVEKNPGPTPVTYISSSHDQTYFNISFFITQAIRKA